MTMERPAPRRRAADDTGAAVPDAGAGPDTRGALGPRGGLGRSDAAAMLAGSAEVLARTLHRCAAERISGAVRVAGEPGGLLHLADGLVIAVETPGAPGVEVQLLRSGRLTEPDWSAAVGALAASDPTGAGGLGTELVGRGLVRAAELERLAVAAVFDGIFAIAAGQVLDCRLVPSDPFWLPAVPGLPVERLWHEIERRRHVLAARRQPVAHDRDRIVPVSQVDRGTVLSPEQWALLRHADGRRTPRDLAFALGRGVYAVTLEIGRLLDAGLVQVASRRDVPRLEPLAPDQPAAPGMPARPGEQPSDGLPRLPRRRPDASDAADTEPSGSASRWAARLPHAWATRTPGE